ncbi:hypothetical protein HCN44_001315 [Aphidius gifuensis]|uniref:Uncharacterized protein n=1 Tax=Aphidius gifuensis TaxID=684658 RepID=A0A834Y1I8_APHGI|nr:hypothetical protein HCN44_001315 [Aphidius gifuensis]
MVESQDYPDESIYENSSSEDNTNDIFYDAYDLNADISDCDEIDNSDSHSVTSESDDQSYEESLDDSDHELNDNDDSFDFDTVEDLLYPGAPISLENKIKNYCEKVELSSKRRKKLTLIQGSSYILGGLKKISTIRQDIQDALQMENINNGLIYLFTRLYQNGLVYDSKSYTRARKNASSFVKYEFQRELLIGEIDSFVKIIHCDNNANKNWLKNFDVDSDGILTQSTEKKTGSPTKKKLKYDIIKTTPIKKSIVDPAYLSDQSFTDASDTDSLCKNRNFGSTTSLSDTENNTDFDGQLHEETSDIDSDFSGHEKNERSHIKIPEKVTAEKYV